MIKKLSIMAFLGHQISALDIIKESSLLQVDKDHNIASMLTQLSQSTDDMEKVINEDQSLG
jgi:hypothetical protein